MKKLLCVLLCAVLSACAQEKILLSITTGKFINPDAKHRALPLLLTLYQLKQRQWPLRPSNIIAKKQVVVLANQHYQINVPLQADTKVVLLVSDNRIDTYDNKHFVKLDHHASLLHLAIDVQQDQLTVEKQT